MNEVNPPQFLPPEGRDAATGAVSLPFEARGMTAYSSCLRGCCWSSRDLYPFGPERLEETSVRMTAQVPESLRALGIDQHEYGAMLEDAKSGLANAAPPIGLCCAGACIFTFVLAPFSICYLLHLSSPGLSDKLIERGANRVEAGDDAVPVGGGGNRARGVGRRAALTAPGSARTCIIDVTQLFITT